MMHMTARFFSHTFQPTFAWASRDVLLHCVPVTSMREHGSAQSRHLDIMHITAHAGHILQVSSRIRCMETCGKPVAYVRVWKARGALQAAERSS